MTTAEPSDTFGVAPARSEWFATKTGQVHGPAEFGWVADVGRERVLRAGDFGGEHQCSN